MINEWLQHFVLLTKKYSRMMHSSEQAFFDIEITSGDSKDSLQNKESTLT